MWNRQKNKGGNSSNPVNVRSFKGSCGRRRPLERPDIDPIILQLDLTPVHAHKKQVTCKSGGLRRIWDHVRKALRDKILNLLSYMLYLIDIFVCFLKPPSTKKITSKSAFVSRCHKSKTSVKVAGLKRMKSETFILVHGYGLSSLERTYSTVQYCAVQYSRAKYITVQ